MERAKSAKRQQHQSQPLAEDDAMKKLWDQIVQQRSRIKQKLAQKTAIAQNLNSTVESIARKLDTDLAFFETE